MTLTCARCPETEELSQYGPDATSKEYGIRKDQILCPEHLRLERAEMAKPVCRLHLDGKGERRAPAGAVSRSGAWMPVCEECLATVEQAVAAGNKPRYLTGIRRGWGA